MKKIAILNFKGRTGKTTAAVNLSHVSALKRQNNRVFTRDSWKKLLLEQTEKFQNLHHTTLPPTCPASQESNQKPSKKRFIFDTLHFSAKIRTVFKNSFSRRR